MDAATATLPSPPRAEEPLAGRRRILLVDESSASHMWIRMILNQTPHELVAARGGEEGVEKARAARPDLVLLNAAMHGMDGIEALRRIRALPGLHDVPVILLTTRAAARTADAGAAGERERTETIAKPVDSAELLQKVRRFLGGGAA